jgi:sterol desaturase/sphingolipid hydroxylase (fatty acid hydroxylase superfamily)
MGSSLRVAAPLLQEREGRRYNESSAVDLIVLAIPVFLLLIGVELAAVWLGRKDYYRLSDTLNDLSCGIFDQVVGVFLKTALFAGYVFVYERLRVATLPGDSGLVWAACFLGVDFLYYWFHRTSHEVNAFWAAHVVHHQSEEFNLAVALRQGALQGAVSWAFYLPLGWLGFPPLVFLTCSSVNTLYQFWIHTRTIGKLGPLEWVLNTPSNHRVHHGRDPKYIDRNHGGTLIVWDRLFGTYAPEQEEPVYGITKPLRSWNPLWAHLHYWVELLDLARRARRLSDRLRVFVKPPGWRPDELGGYAPAPEVDRASYRKWDVPLPRGVAVYALAHFGLLLAISAAYLNLERRLAPDALLWGAAWIVLSLLALGALLERRRWAPYLEAARLAGMLALGAVYGLGVRSLLP